MVISDLIEIILIIYCQNIFDRSFLKNVHFSWFFIFTTDFLSVKFVVFLIITKIFFTKNLLNLNHFSKTSYVTFNFCTLNEIKKVQKISFYKLLLYFFSWYNYFYTIEEILIPTYDQNLCFPRAAIYYCFHH